MAYQHIAADLGRELTELCRDYTDLLDECSDLRQRNNDLLDQVQCLQWEIAALQDGARHG